MNLGGVGNLSLGTRRWIRGQAAGEKRHLIPGGDPQKVAELRGSDAVVVLNSTIGHGRLCSHMCSESEQHLVHDMDTGWTRGDRAMRLS